MADRHVTGITYVSGITQISVKAIEGRSDVQLQVFQSMAKHHISVDFINVTPSGATYTVFDQDAIRAVEVLQEVGLFAFCSQRLRKGFRYRRRNEWSARCHGPNCRGFNRTRHFDYAICRFKYDDLGTCKRARNGSSFACAACKV